MGAPLHAVISAGDLPLRRTATISQKMDNGLEQDDYTQSSQNAGGGSGLKLILPSLKSVQALKGKKKHKNLTLAPVQDETVRRPTRPVKLKPLKEVLTKLIAQIRKKDDYAFFLEPVDVTKVSGYTDVVKRPMDLGTMTTKVEKGKYRSLEEFAEDLRLVTTNAKTFNLPGSIYHTEAERIEAWALEHIAKAAASVIEYETDWNIEIERDDLPVRGEDDDGTQVQAIGDAGTGEKAVPMDVDEGGRGRSPSVASTHTPVPGQVGSRRAGRGGASAKKPPGALSESLEPDGGLPGAKDGLGVFPPGSDWAELMLALKLKGKRYRTKKERLRMERGGPPYSADGSLDYAEMEDPFSVLSFFVPDPPSRPLLTPLYPTLPPSDLTQPSLPAPVNVPPTPILPSLSSSNSTQSTNGRCKTKRQHWAIIRNAPGRGRVKDKDDDDYVPLWKVPREASATDYGAFGTLVGLLAKERGVRDVGAGLGSEERLYKTIRTSLDETTEPTKHRLEIDIKDVEMQDVDQQYWKWKDRVAEEYVRDIVYGGVDGLAYVRSLAEFVDRSAPLESSCEPPAYAALGSPLARWVEQLIVDPLTDGRHRVLAEAARHLCHPQYPTDPSIVAQVDLSTKVFPRAARELAALQQIAHEQIDMAALIRTPAELFQAEDVWAGAEYKRRLRQAAEEARERALTEAPAKHAAEYLQFAIDSHREAEAASSNAEDPAVLQHALESAAETIVNLNKRVSDGSPLLKEGEGAKTLAADGGIEQNEHLALRGLRLNLLALAKRAPLDKITKLPAELVPDHLRSVVPTIDA
ncbi:hypothetical protein AcV5_001679 [Taiwanofungus camphoratus]|nr:hypothetical protein AcV5_001679 [Antrodia cinnamomea]